MTTGCRRRDPRRPAYWGRTDHRGESTIMRRIANHVTASAVHVLAYTIMAVVAVAIVTGAAADHFGIPEDAYRTTLVTTQQVVFVIGWIAFIVKMRGKGPRRRRR